MTDHFRLFAMPIPQQFEDEFLITHGRLREVGPYFAPPWPPTMRFSPYSIDDVPDFAQRAIASGGVALCPKGGVSIYFPFVQKMICFGAFDTFSHSCWPSTTNLPPRPPCPFAQSAAPFCRSHCLVDAQVRSFLSPDRFVFVSPHLTQCVYIKVSILHCPCGQYFSHIPFEKTQLVYVCLCKTCWKFKYQQIRFPQPFDLEQIAVCFPPLKNRDFLSRALDGSMNIIAKNVWYPLMWISLKLRIGNKHEPAFSF